MKNLFGIQIVTARWTSFIYCIGFRHAPCTLLYCLTVKQAFGNLGLLAGYGAKPIGAGLGRDRVVSERYLTTSYTAHTCPNEL